MKAIGRIAWREAAATGHPTGHPTVHLYVGGTWQRYGLSNADDIPQDHPDFGLFRFEPTDQFCTWIDPAKESIRRGDALRIKPKWQDPGDDTLAWVALEDEDGGRVRIAVLLDLPILPTQVVTTEMVERVV